MAVPPPRDFVLIFIEYYLWEVSSRCPSSLNSDAYGTAKHVEIRIFIYQLIDKHQFAF